MEAKMERGGGKRKMAKTVKGKSKDKEPAFV